MKGRSTVAAVALFGLFAFAAAGQEAGTWDGLVEVKPKRLDAAFLKPGADFRPYTKVMIDQAEVAFRKDWLKRVNDSMPVSSRISQEDAEKILAEARKNFAEVFAEVFADKGISIVTEPGPDVLRVRPGVIDLYIAAPDRMSSSRSRTYTMESGEATLFLEVLDSTSLAILGRALDKRATRNTGRVSISNSVTNRADFRALFRQWAEICVKGFEDLHAMSPVPEDLEPGQKLASSR
jgi:Protein of unknown function (DUF3313)